jgi:thymidylate synthase
MITGSSVNYLYRQTLDLMLAQHEDTLKSAPRGMPIWERLGVSLRLRDAMDCVVGIPSRKLNYHFMVAEFWWIASASHDVEMISKYCETISKFSDDGKVFFGAYGPPWNEQLEYVVNKLHEDKDSRQAVLTIWRPSPPATKDVPCTVAMQYLIREGKLNTIVTMRSSDAWLGLPYDIFNFARLGAMVAGELNVPQGWLQLNLGSLHLYERDAPRAMSVAVSPWASDVHLRQVPIAGCVSPQTLNHWERMARIGHIGTAHQPWSDYLTVLMDRHRPDTALSDEWRRLIHASTTR